jgi:hypothetical protein
MEDESSLEPEPIPQIATLTDDNEMEGVHTEDLEPDASPLLNHAQQAEVEHSQELSSLLEIEIFGGKAGKPIKIGQPANVTQQGSHAGGTDCCNRDGGTNGITHGSNAVSTSGTEHGGNAHTYEVEHGGNVHTGGTEHGRTSQMEHNSTNPYAPFLSRTDWEIAKWGKLRGPSSTAFTELLEIPGVSSHEQW